MNLGAFEVEGVDFGIDYGFELGSVGLEGWGAIDFGLNGTKLIDFNEYQDPIDNTVFETRVGEFGYPEWIVNANASWSFKDLVLTWQGRYEESSYCRIIKPAICGQPVLRRSITIRRVLGA